MYIRIMHQQQLHINNNNIESTTIRCLSVRPSVCLFVCTEQIIPAGRLDLSTVFVCPRLSVRPSFHLCISKVEKFYILFNFIIVSVVYFFVQIIFFLYFYLFIFMFLVFLLLISSYWVIGVRKLSLMFFLEIIKYIEI